MIFQKQLNKHNPPEIHGDCLRTVWACILDMRPEEIPNFGELSHDPELRFKEETKWLAARGLREVRFAFASPLEHVFEVMKNCNPDMVYMLSGTSANGCNHVVLAMNDQIVWDPAQDNSGIIGPCDMHTKPAEEAYYWVEFLVPRIWTRHPDHDWEIAK